MINHWIGEGRIAKDFELRRTQSGKAVVNFVLCNERVHQTEDASVDYINCVCWNKLAENLEKHCQKGSLISVEGRVQNRSYDNATGQKVYITEILCERIHYLHTNKRNDSSQEEIQQQEFEEAQNKFDIAEEDIQF